jgi:hypothetical protein
VSDQNAGAGLVIPFSSLGEAFGEDEAFLALTIARAAVTLCFEGVCGLDSFDPDRVLDGVVGVGDDDGAELRLRVAVGDVTLGLAGFTPVEDCGVWTTVPSIFRNGLRQQKC